MFGSSLGTGDYGLTTIEHASMLLRNFLSLREFTNQGFEATHSSQRVVYAKATSRDRHGHATSSKFLFKNLVNFSSQLGKLFHVLRNKTVLYDSNVNYLHIGG